MKRLTALTVIFGCTSCSWQFSVPGFGERDITADGPNISQTLKKLPAVPLLESSAEGQGASFLQEPDPAEVLALYQSVLDRIADAEANYHVARRVAELQLQQAEDAAIRGEAEPYREAVAALERLLADEN